MKRKKNNSVSIINSMIRGADQSKLALPYKHASVHSNYHFLVFQDKAENETVIFCCPLVIINKGAGLMRSIPGQHQSYFLRGKKKNIHLITTETFWRETQKEANFINCF